MTYLPTLRGVKTTRVVTADFRGLDKRVRAAENTFSDMKNLTGDNYPVASPRRARGTVASLTAPNGLFRKDELLWVDGTSLYFGGAVVGSVANSFKQFVSMGSKVIIWPDKLAYDTASGTLESLEASFSTVGTVTFSLTDAEGTAYTYVSTEPASPTDGAYWLDSSGAVCALMRYSASMGTWVAVPTTYVKLAAAGVGSLFSKYDGVSVSGTTCGLDGEYTLYGAGADFIVFMGVLSSESSQSAAVTVERRVPDMDYIVESDNRLWGCSGENRQIYASKLGDPKNFSSFMGLSTDSYALSVGSDGDFTGVAAHQGYVMFFKEDMIHKIYGYQPSNFQTVDTNARGVEKGSWRSLAVVNETLYYKSPTGVCALMSSLPETVSAPLCGPYRDAVAGSLGDKYYVSVLDDEDNAQLFVFDEAKGLWHREDDTRFCAFCRLNGELYGQSASGEVIAMTGREGTSEGAVEWMAETAELGLDSPDYKYVSRLSLRLAVEAGSEVFLDMACNGEPFARVFSSVFTRRRTVSIPIVPKRADSVRLRLSGRGGFSLYSITKTTENGTELSPQGV